MERLQTMKCGQCGHAKATLKAIPLEYREGYSKVEITCCQCSSTTVLRLSEPTILAEPKENSPGTFCCGWHDGT